MRSEISHVHPEIRTQIPDEIIDCNQVSFPAPFADNHKNIENFCRKVWRFKKNAYLCSPFEKKRIVLRNNFGEVKEDERRERELPCGNDRLKMRSLTQ